MNNVNAQVVFTISREGYPDYTDALYIPIDEYRDMSVSQVEALKQERYDAWREHIDNPPDPEPADAPQPVSSVEQARQILTDALTQLDALPADPVDSPEE